MVKIELTLSSYDQSINKCNNQGDKVFTAYYPHQSLVPDNLIYYIIPISIQT